MEENIRKILRLPIKEPIEYFERYWKYYTKELLDKDNYNLIPDSPRFVIDNIISEIEYNDFKNEENRKLFRMQLGEWNKKDEVFHSIFCKKVELLMKKWDCRECTIYLLTICKQILTEMEQGIYYNAIMEHLVSIVEKSSTINYKVKKDISKYTELIVAEFIAKNFVLEDIRFFLDYEDIACIESGKVIAAPTSFRGLVQTAFNDEKSYYQAIEDFINHRSVRDRISVLNDYYFKNYKDGYALIRLSGIKGDIDFAIDDINIYTPHRKKYITDEYTISDIEKIDKERLLVNAAIPIKHRTSNTSFSFAINKLEKILDILALTYNVSEPIGYVLKNSSIVEKGIVICCKNVSITDETTDKKHQEFVNYMNSLDLSNRKDDIEILGKRVSAISKKLEQDTLKLATAAHWCQKGKSAKTSEDKLLFHWISIESLLKTSENIALNILKSKNSRLLEIIQTISSALLVKKHFYNYCFDTYLDLNYVTQYNDNYYDISANTIEKASLNMKAGDKVEVRKFFENINEIVNNANDEIYKTKLEELRDFYATGNGIKEKENEVENNILLIYRLRNLIAHNAVYPKYLIDFYANKIQMISCVIVRYLIDKYRTENLGIDEILINIVSDYDEFKLDIEERITKLKS